MTSAYRSDRAPSHRKTTPVMHNRPSNAPRSYGPPCPTSFGVASRPIPPRPNRVFTRGTRLGSAAASAILALMIAAYGLGADQDAFPAHYPQAGQTAGPESSRGTSDGDIRRAAIEQIPWEQLSPWNRERVLEVVNRSAMFRRMPSRVIECEPEFYQFLVENPNVVVGVWQVLGVTKMRLEQRADGGYLMDDAAGTVAHLRYLLRSPNCHVVYGEGQYSGPFMLRPVQGRCVVVLNSTYIREDEGRAYVSAELDLFVQIDRAGLELLTKAMNPFFGAMAENNYRQTFAFLGSLYRTAAVRSTAMRYLAGQLTNVSPSVREQFVRLIADAAERASEEQIRNPEDERQPEIAETPSVEKSGGRLR